MFIEFLFQNQTLAAGQELGSESRSRMVVPPPPASI